ncbi:N-acetylmuramoyl-L-alanine amidase family protein [Mucilaginibacter sp. SP1R1]|uniref:N-acetylmuramoyl-L-alanine amidase family protein n=1 Tax=Mucilaginibacter sp. SP1R1 TaxID=2723091 RepID=UPI001615B223|nr:N-acetylmuramoyl-L-alanine amidase [Mucilaginibacter sp. SP1R1]MBB6149149.1 N-acetylmuramoyl-L-alanine amidase [Mucilaginibacter sp. SP1R1]
MKNRALKRLIYSLSVLLTFLSFFPVTSYGFIKKDTTINNLKKDTVINNTGFKIKTIIIDPGHGGKPSSTVGHYSHGASGEYSSERNVTLAIALKLQKAVEKDITGVKAVLTRSTEDDVSFERRAEIANENKGNIFISIHCNSLSDRRVSRRVGTKHHKPVYKTSLVPDRSGKGVLLLVYGLHRTKEEENAIKNNQIEGDSELDGGALDPNDPVTIILTNEYKRKFRQQSINLANLINREFVDTDGRPSEGIREQGIYVLCHSSMPSVLVETGYINNPADEAYLNSEDGQNEIVNSIVRALTSYKNAVEQVAQ